MVVEIRLRFLKIQLKLSRVKAIKPKCRQKRHF